MKYFIYLIFFLFQFEFAFSASFENVIKGTNIRVSLIPLTKDGLEQDSPTKKTEKFKICYTSALTVKSIKYGEYIRNSSEISENVVRVNDHCAMVLITPILDTIEEVLVDFTAEQIKFYNLQD